MFAYPTLRRTIRKSRKNIFATLSVKLDGIRARKWNSKRVIIFLLVILQRAEAVNNAKHICTRIQFWLYFWNRGAFEKLAKDTFNTASVFLGKACRIQSKDQHHHKFLKLVLKGKLHEVVIFFCIQETGEFFNPENWQRIEWALFKNPSRQSWQENIRTKTIPPVPCYTRTKKRLFLFP